MKALIKSLILLAVLCIAAITTGCRGAAEPAATPAPTAEADATEPPYETFEPVSTAEPDSGDEEVTFLSPQFENAIRNRLRLYADMPVKKRDLRNVRKIDLSGLGLTDIRDIAMLENLDELILSENKLSDISALAALTKLQKLDLRGTGITDVSALAGLTELTELVIARNPIADLGPLSGLTKLQKLDIGDYSSPEHTPPTDDLSPLASLTELRELTATAKDTAPLAGMERMKLLVLSGSFTDLDGLTNMLELRELWLTGSGGPLDLSGIAGLTSLRTLSIKIFDTADISPLAGLTGLTWLNLSSLPITDLTPLAGLTQLTDLFIYWTNITDLTPLYGLTKLTDCNLCYNDLPEGEVRKLREALPNSYIFNEESDGIN
ncbi:MAG: leucine-rich repeat domain-containing protein [Clostridia bacterium]|nr:leucine-rich repeat domain-containing protein [Clostridia bacterium]